MGRGWGSQELDLSQNALDLYVAWAGEGAQESKGSKKDVDQMGGGQREEMGRRQRARGLFMGCRIRRQNHCGQAKEWTEGLKDFGSIVLEYTTCTIPA